MTISLLWLTITMATICTIAYLYMDPMKPSRWRIIFTASYIELVVCSFIILPWIIHTAIDFTALTSQSTIVISLVSVLTLDMLITYWLAHHATGFKIGMITYNHAHGNEKGASAVLYFFHKMFGLVVAVIITINLYLLTFFTIGLVYILAQ